MVCRIRSTKEVWVGITWSDLREVSQTRVKVEVRTGSVQSDLREVSQTPPKDGFQPRTTQFDLREVSQSRVKVVVRTGSAQSDLREVSQTPPRGELRTRTPKRGHPLPDGTHPSKRGYPKRVQPRDYAMFWNVKPCWFQA